MSLPASWVDSLFARLTVRYGRPFVSLYEGFDLDTIKADWSDVLGGFHDKPEAIAYALEHLPVDRAPNALQFREMCRRAPDSTPKLPAPMADKRVADEAVKRLGGMKIGRKPGLEWAYRLRDCELKHGGDLSDAGFQGHPLGRLMTGAQRAAWREALKFEATEGEAA